MDNVVAICYRVNLDGSYWHPHSPLVLAGRVASRWGPLPPVLSTSATPHHWPLSGLLLSTDNVRNQIIRRLRIKNHIFILVYNLFLWKTFHFRAGRWYKKGKMASFKSWSHQCLLFFFMFVEHMNYVILSSDCSYKWTSFSIYC